MTQDDFPYFLDCLVHLAACFPTNPPLEEIAPEYFGALSPFAMTLVEEVLITARRNLQAFPRCVQLLDLAIGIGRARASEAQHEVRPVQLLAHLIPPRTNGTAPRQETR